MFQKFDPENSKFCESRAREGGGEEGGGVKPEITLGKALPASSGSGPCTFSRDTLGYRAEPEL